MKKKKKKKKKQVKRIGRQQKNSCGRSFITPKQILKVTPQKCILVGSQPTLKQLMKVVEQPKGIEGVI
jgi:hypothetical protein